MSQTPDATLVPRPLTKAVRRQSWRELPVRSWLLMTIALVLVIFAVGIHEVVQSLADRRLIAQGVRVNGRIDLIAGGTRNADRSTTLMVTLSFVLPGETERRVLKDVFLDPSPSGGFISKGDTLPILVNPKDITKWSDRVDPASWLVVLAVPLLLIPIVVLLALLTLLARWRIERLYQRGSIAQMSVIEAHRSALVPGQKVVKFAKPGGGTLSAAHPDSLGPVVSCDRIDAIVDDLTKPTRAIVAKAYVVP